jgi:monofunctional biosynthetic peptidoglycan transglycosylase
MFFLLKVLKFILKTIMWFFIISIGLTIIYRFVPVPVTPLMIIRCVEQKQDGKDMMLKKDWVPYDEISPALPLAVVAAEDQLFLDHYGFDFNAIEKALKNNEKKSKRKKMKGASTISQQTAKNVFLWPSRTWVRKGFEVYFTGLIEIFWSKQRILEVYLNVVEMGDGVYGAEAAARHHFKKSAAKLSRSEAAAIAACLPNPRKWSASKPTGYISGRQAWILRNMNNIERLDFENEDKEENK